MNSPKRVLACSDFSVAARHAAERAALLSKSTGAPLDLLHAADVSPLQALRTLIGQGSDDLQRLVVDAGRRRLAELAAGLAQRYGVNAGCSVFTGSVLAAIGRAADTDPPGLIACGAAGESAARQMLLGSTAERLLSRAGCPVLVVKQMPRTDYRRLLLAVDFSPSSRRAIGDARVVAPRAEVVVMHAFEVPFEGHMRYASVAEATIDRYREAARQEALRKLAAFASEAGLPPATPLSVQHGSPVACIVEHEQESDCDLIVMGRRGLNIAEELLLGSVTKRVLAQCQGDVLVSI
jgi:nucleotide-binding universal stress UspA family protein